MRKWKQLPLVSGGLVICNVIIFLCCLFDIGDLYGAGGLDAAAVIKGKEYGRIIWAMFLHGDTSHLFNNMLILFFLGAMIEGEVGHFRYGVLYFLSGIGGNILSLYMKIRTADPAMSIGASGAVFGLDGVLLAMVLLWDRRLENVTPERVLVMIILSLYSGFTGGNIDNAAHVGGLFVGFVAGGIMCMAHRIKSRAGH